ncbi:MAG: hypothetical protein K2N06_03635 [Oscillospiraceae bacterium]|nr:hypothetical protein [Oscillospiraceae bacterium]
MTLKTKRRLAVFGGTVLCAMLAMLITTRFVADKENAPPSVSAAGSDSEIRAEIPEINSEIILGINPEISKPKIQKPPIKNPEIQSENQPENNSELIEVKQNFPEPEKENSPPPPPKIEDEKTLTNPDAEPIYEPEQTEIKPPEISSNTPNHGDKKDGQIYINGFGWVKDEGGGGVAESAPEMYENGNKIGYLG